MPRKNNKPYERWDVRKAREAQEIEDAINARKTKDGRKALKTKKRFLVIPPRPVDRLGAYIWPICQYCGKKIEQRGNRRPIRSRKYCGRECTGKANIRRLYAWENAIGDQLRNEGWTILLPSACCDRIGIKDGHVFFLEFKPEGRTALRSYQKTLREAAPDVYRVIVATIGEGKPEILNASWT